MDNSFLPSLIDGDFREFLYEKLHKCHDYKMYVYSWIINSLYLIIFIIIFIAIIYLSRSPKLTPLEKHFKIQKEQEYILTKIREYQEMNKTKSSLITDLPVNHYLADNIE